MKHFDELEFYLEYCEGLLLLKIRRYHEMQDLTSFFLVYCYQFSIDL